MPHDASRPKRLFVSGGRGRLAALIADHFRAPDYEVVLFSREARHGFQPLADLTTAAKLRGADTVLHLAWSTLPATAERAESGEDLRFVEQLLAGLRQIEAGTRPHLVFFSSGGTVYGNAGDHPSRETDPCRPIGAYGRTKLAAEHLIREADGDVPASTILRISNPYGYPVPRARAQGVIPHAIRCAVEGRPLTLWGDGQARKDFLYYTDFLAALREVIDRRLAGLHNLSAGSSHSVREILELVELHTDRAIVTETTPAPAWDVQDSRLDNQQFIAATGWRPQVELAEGIRRSVAGFLEL